MARFRQQAFRLRRWYDADPVSPPAVETFVFSGAIGLAVLLFAVPILLLGRQRSTFNPNPSSSDGSSSDISTDIMTNYTSGAMITRVCFSNGFFDLDFKFGSFSFDEAKLVDVIWDLLIGRGGQLFLLFFSCRVFWSALLRVIELIPVPYKLYTAVSLRPGEASTLLPLAKSLWKTPGWRVKLTLFGVLLATLNVIIFPTIASAMTSYVPVSKVFILSTEGESLDYSSLMPSLLLPDASKIGLSDGIRLGHDNKWYNADGTVNNTDISTQYQVSEAGKEKAKSVVMSLWDAIASPNITAIAEGDTNRLNISGLNARAPGSSTWFLCPYQQYSGQSWWSTNNTWECPVFNGTFHFELFKGSQHFSQEFISDPANSVCLMPNNAEAYQWGFSYGMVSVLAVLMGIWVIACYVIWWDARKHSVLVKKGRKIGTLRSCIDLARVLRENCCGPGDGMGDEGGDLMAEKELRAKMDDRVEEIRVEYMIERNSRDGAVQGVRLRTAERSQNAKEKYMAVVEEQEVSSDIASEETIQVPERHYRYC